MEWPSPPAGLDAAPEVLRTIMLYEAARALAADMRGREELVSETARQALVDQADRKQGQGQRVVDFELPKIGQRGNQRGRAAHLYAGCRSVRKQVSPELIPRSSDYRGFDIVLYFSTRKRWFPCGPLPGSHLTQSNRAFSFSVHHHTP